MTNNTRDYLADLALKKGVNLGRVESYPQEYASKKIDELKRLPDASFAPLTAEDETRLLRKINEINKEIGKWTLTA